MSAAPFRSGLIQGVPIALGYLPIAFSFGVAATGMGFSALEATFLSVVVYAGASQFLALALLSSGAPVLVTAGTLVAMNLRHLLYGPSLVRAAGDRAPVGWAWIWGWGLTDEVFGQALAGIASGGRFSEAKMTGLALAAYAAWVGGTVLGAMAGGEALAGWPAVQAGLGFLLTALFLSLLLSVATRAALPSVAVAIAATVAGSAAFGAAGGILAGMIAGAAAGMVRR
jgi:4-azaleucine resistance transporter AzlC